MIRAGNHAALGLTEDSRQPLREIGNSKGSSKGTAYVA